MDQPPGRLDPPSSLNRYRMGSSPRVVGGRFRVVELVSAHGGVETHRAEDLGGGHPGILLKWSHHLPATEAGRAQLESAAEGAKRLSAGGASALLEMRVEESSMWAARTWADGLALGSRLGAGPLSADEALVVARDVLRALARVHAAGLTHPGIHPGNVLLAGAPGPVTGAALLDLGTSRQEWALHWRVGGAIQPGPCTAPERRSTSGPEPDIRSDLFSVGAVIFESVAGRALTPGQPSGPGGAPGTPVVSRPADGPVTDLRSLGIDVPKAMGDLVSRLVGTDPQDRYQTAEGALYDVERVIAGRAAGDSDPPVVIGRGDRRSVLTRPVFVGRETELGVLTAALERAREGKGGLVLVEGPSGGGKSRLLAELASRASAHGVWVLSGQGVDRTAQRPFQLLDGVAAGIAARAAADPRLSDRLRFRLGERLDATAAALPQLATVLAPGASPSLPEEHGESRSIHALSALLDALGEDGHPALVVLDDCQWAETVTAQVLRHWHNRSGGGARWVTVVAAYRTGELDPRSALLSVRPDADVAMGPFSDQNVTDLAGSMAGPLPFEAERALLRLAEQSPFMTHTVLRGMVDSGALASSGSGWEAVPVVLAAVDSCPDARGFLRWRLGHLSEPASRLLEAAAVLGKEFRVSLAGGAADLEGPVTDRALAEVAGAGFVAAADRPGWAAFVHDRFREAVLARLGPRDRAALHNRAAVLLEEGGSASPFELAYHFEAAGLTDQALDHALAAAAEARAQHALEAAETNYRIAVRASLAADESIQARTAEGLADVLALRGSYVDAEEELRRAAALTTDRTRLAELEGKLGDVAFRRGDQGMAVRQLERALRQLGRWVPAHRVTMFMAALWEVLVQAAHTISPGLLTGRKRRPPTDEELLAMRLYSRSAYAYWFRSGRAPCAWAHLRGMNMAERFGPSLALAQSYSEHAPVMTMLPHFSRGISYARRSLAIRTDLEDLWGRGQSLNFYGVVLYAASRYEESIERCQEAVRILSRTGDRWETNTAVWHIGFAEYRLGNLEEAARILRDLYRDALQMGDYTSAGIALGGWARASGGDVPADAVATEMARHNEDVHTATELRMAEALRLLREDRPEEAADVLEEAWERVRKAGLRQEYVMPVLPWLATALRAAGERTGSAAGSAGVQEGGGLRGRQLRAAHRAYRLALRYRNNLPHAARELALAEAARGRPRRAARALEMSLRVALEQGAADEARLTREAMGTLGIDGPAD